MRATVFTDARLMKLAGRFAWLDVDTERPGNFAFVERFPIEVWPTILVIDPADERVLLRWLGTATAPELERLLGDAERAHRQERGDAAGAELARGLELAARRQHGEAAGAFEAALRAGGPRWPERTRTADALLQALQMAGAPKACAGAAARLLPAMERGPAFARVAAAGLDCATQLDEPAARDPAIRAVEPSARLALRVAGVLADDRAGLYGNLVAARKALGDAAGARRLAREWLAFAEDEARRAPTPLARSAFDGARLSAALELGEARRVLPALRESARALPEEYFAQSYQAVCALEAGEPQEALEAARRAVALAEGPRKVRVMTVEAQALHALGDDEGARAALTAAIAHGEGLPEAVRPVGYLKAARRLREKWDPKGEVDSATAPAPAAAPAPAPVSTAVPAPSVVPSTP
jgi:tetratricopeptide (TPR) repeat protein